MICGRCIAWQLDTKVLAHHVADKLAFAVVLSDSWQISQLLDRAAVPYVVLNGYARDFPNARAVIRDSSSEYCAELVAYMKARGMKKMLGVDFERIGISPLFERPIDGHAWKQRVVRNSFPLTSEMIFRIFSVNSEGWQKGLRYCFAFASHDSAAPMTLLVMF